jgi:hypothetical protein
MTEMNVRKPFKLLLAILVTAGLTIAPPVTLATVGHPFAAETMQMAGTSDMMADMPCCPDKKSGDCQDCPLIAICMLKLLHAGPSTQAVVLHLSAHQQLQPADDRLVDGLGEHPPDHPPRTIV